MSNRIPVLLICTLLLVGLSGNAFAQTQNFGAREPWPSTKLSDPPGGHDDEGTDSFGFGKKIAGTWLGTGEFAFDPDCDGVGDVPPTVFDYDSQSFSASGLYMASTVTNPAVGHGTWKKTGHREITTNNIVYLTNPDGGLDFILRIPGVFTFDSDFKTATSTFGAIGYLPGENPLDPDVVPQWCTAGKHYLLQKVTVTE